MQLKKEHGGGKHADQGIRLQQRTLFRMLDVLDDAVIAVNESEEIRFCNRAGENLLRHPADALCGRLIWSIFRAKTDAVLRPFLCGIDDGVSAQEEKKKILRVGLELLDGNNCFVNVQVAPLLHAKTLYYIFILTWPGNASGFVRQQWGEASNRADEELAGIHERIKELGEILPGTLPESVVETGKVLFSLSEINRSLARLNFLLQSPLPPSKERRFLAVKVMNLCVECWTEYSGADKFDLARDSKLWTVYTNLDGWERTQTLDKYFDVKTLPGRPNWKKIMATADFVLNSCLTPSSSRASLERFSERLHFSMAG